MNRLFFALLLLILACPPMMCGDEKEVPFAQWSWEFPEEDAQKYPITEHYFWNPQKDFFGAGFRYLHLRDREETDQDNIGFGGSVRPIIFNFGGDISLSMGAYGVYSHAWTDGSRVPELSIASQYDVEDESYGTGVSMMLSWPATGIQCFLEVGHYWSRSELNSKSVTVPDFQALGYDYTKGRLLQKERGMEYWFEFSYLIDRLYLYGITIDLYGSAPTGPREANARVYIPADLQPFFGDAKYIQNSVEPTETGFFMTLAYLRAFAVEVMPKNRITVEPVGGIGYFRESHGHNLIAGVRLNMFDLAGFSWYYVWERNNDAEDSQVFNVELGFRFGRKLSGRNN